MSGYRLTDSAKRDVDEILDYIVIQSVQNAILVSTRLEKAFRRITQMPGIGHRRTELADPNAHVLSVSGYLVIFDPTLSPIRILRVVRGTRNLEGIRLGE